MVFRVKSTSQAKQDARQILAWLRDQQAGDSGLRWFHGLRKAIESLTDLPARCTLAPESDYLHFEVRQLLYGSTHHRYRILFTIEGDEVIVLHIRHGRRHRLAH